MTPRRIGFLVNPIAGMGGAVALKGTDGVASLAEAWRRGARPLANERACNTLRQLANFSDRLELITVAGTMGGDCARSAGLRACEVAEPGNPTSARDTALAVSALLDAGAEWIVFAGGDGTARDVHAALGDRCPMLGIPTGVKMHSGVFATSPVSAGRLIRDWIADPTRIASATVEIMDMVEIDEPNNRIAPRLFGYAIVPAERRLMQQAKARAMPSDEAAVAEAARAIASALQAGVTYVIGPGRSAKAVLGALGLKGTLLGVDLIRDGRLIGLDLSAEDLRCRTNGQTVRIIVGVTGGQGFLFGRGNQQIGPDVIACAGRNGLIVIAGRRKLATLADARLLVDTGDPAVDAELEGFLRVRCGRDIWSLMRVAAA
jgi:predicted polyphosphate/ATP-dependent NAD kinase